MELSIELYKLVMEYIPACIYFKDTECRYVFASRFMNDPLSNERFDVNGLTDFDVVKDPVAAQHAYDATKAVIESGKGICFVNDFSLPDKPVFFEIRMEPVYKDGKLLGVLGMMSDITERILLEKKLESYARTDSLTGLYNRFYLDYWRQNELKPSMYPLFIIAADCDGLKEVNDTFGHQVGDEYLHLSSSVFRVGLPEEAIKFRLGGDEFLVIIPNTDEKEGKRLIEHMEGLAKYITIKKEKISISFGSSVIAGPEDDFDKKLKEADEKMYSSKVEHHKNRE